MHLSGSAGAGGAREGWKRGCGNEYGERGGQEVGGGDIERVSGKRDKPVSATKVVSLSEQKTHKTWKNIFQFVSLSILSRTVNEGKGNIHNI